MRIFAKKLLYRFQKLKFHDSREESEIVGSKSVGSLDHN